MAHIHRNVMLTGLAALALVSSAYALLGIGLAAIVAVGLTIVAALVIPAIVVYEEETHLPLARRRARR